MDMAVIWYEIISFVNSQFLGIIIIILLLLLFELYGLGYIEFM